MPEKIFSSRKVTFGHFSKKNLDFSVQDEHQTTPFGPLMIVNIYEKKNFIKFLRAQWLLFSRKSLLAKLRQFEAVPYSSVPQRTLRVYFLKLYIITFQKIHNKNFNVAEPFFIELFSKTSSKNDRKSHFS